MNEARNKVFIATSLDGYIADKNGGLDWLHATPNPEGIDMGYGQFMAGMDALIMGRNTFETVCNFDMPWPYQKPVFVLTNTLKKVPNKAEGKATLVSGSLKDVLEEIHKQGYHQLYIDGGQTIQNFLEEDLIDEMIITTIPVLLGGGTPLFGKLSVPIHFRCVESQLFLNSIVQSRYVRING